MNVFATQQIISQFSMAAISFVIACKEVKIAQIIQLFQFLNLICTYGDAFYWLTSMLISKNVNNDVSKDSPFSTKQNIPSIIAFLKLLQVTVSRLN